MEVREDIPITNGKLDYYNNYKIYPEVTLTTNSHQYVTYKPLKLPNSIENTTKCLICKTKKKLVFNWNYLGLANNNIQNILKKYNTSKEKTCAILNIIAYKPGQLLDKIRAGLNPKI